MSVPGQIKCVRIHHSVYGTGSFEPVWVLANNPIFAASPTPSSVVWKPLLVVRRESKSTQDKLYATWLMVDPHTGLAPEAWKGSIGNAIVARKDKKDLSVELCV